MALSEGERHGYAIMREAEASGFRMGPGTLYRSIERLIEQNRIEEVERAAHEEGSERRPYYRLTEVGDKALRAEAARLASLVERAVRLGGST